MSLRKVKEEMDSTDSPKVYRLARKYYLAGTGDISCVFCPYHKKENQEKKWERNWKRYRKTKYKRKVTEYA